MFLVCALANALWLAARERPALLIAGSGVTAPIAVFVGALFRIPTVTLVHGLDLAAKHLPYRYGFLPFIRGSRLVIANSRNTARLAQEAGIDPRKIHVIHPGVAVPARSPKKPCFKSSHGLQDRRVLLFVGRLVARKGLEPFVRFALPEIVKACPQAVLVVIGAEPENAIKRDKECEARLRRTVDELDLTRHVRLLGEVNESTLNDAYREAAVFVFPVLDLDDDVEGFGMVAIEAAAHGLPVIAFAAGGVSDAVDHRRSGFLVRPEDYTAFAEKVVAQLKNRSNGALKRTCYRHAQRFTWGQYGAKLAHLCDAIIES